jgi:protein-S-isoprenylcysteine O-methyltransferase Ste14
MSYIQLSGLFIVLLFYSSYFGKLLLQRRQGIITDRMGRGIKPKRTFIIEIILKVTTYLMALVQIISIAMNNNWYMFITNINFRYTGIGIALLGVIIFVMAMSTMRNSWRAGVDSSQKTKLIKHGIYRFSRNPAFLGFDLFYIGITMAFFNPLQLIFLCFSICILHLQIMEEEKFLPTIFGDEYTNYRQSTGRYFMIF